MLHQPARLCLPRDSASRLALLSFEKSVSRTQPSKKQVRDPGRENTSVKMQHPALWLLRMRGYAVKQTNKKAFRLWRFNKHRGRKLCLRSTRGRDDTLVQLVHNNAFLFFQDKVTSKFISLNCDLTPRKANGKQPVWWFEQVQPFLFLSDVPENGFQCWAKSS